MTSKVLVLALCMFAVVSSRTLKVRQVDGVDEQVELEARHHDQAPNCAEADNKECVAWKGMGLCGDKAYARHCGNTCGLCGNQVELAVEERHHNNAPDCAEKDNRECIGWKSMGLCGKSVYDKHCAHTCGYCGNEVEVEVAARHHNMTPDCAEEDNSECVAWKGMGLCGEDSYDRHCAHTCGLCK